MSTQMTVSYLRPRDETRLNAPWRQWAPGRGVPEARGRPIAFAFSLSEPLAEVVCAALNTMHVATIVRAFDADAEEIVSSAAPDIVVLACDPMSADGIRAITLLAQHGPWHLLVFDAGEARLGTPAALDAGADMVLNVDADESIVRATLGALLRRSTRTDRPSQAVEDLQSIVGDLTVDEDTYEVRDDGELVSLTPTEFKVVADLALHAGYVRSPSQLMTALHGYPVTDFEARETVRVYMRRIRNKLAGCQRRSVEIISYRGRGYRLEPTAQGEDAIGSTEGHPE